MTTIYYHEETGIRVNLCAQDVYSFLETFKVDPETYVLN